MGSARQTVRLVGRDGDAHGWSNTFHSQVPRGLLARVLGATRKCPPAANRISANMHRMATKRAYWRPDASHLVPLPNDPKNGVQLARARSVATSPDGLHRDG